MNQTYRRELHRTYLFEHLPEPMTPADRHLQIFDNYIEGTRMRLRSLRVPETKEWTWILQQRFPVGEGLAEWRIAEIYLNEREHERLEYLDGREIRKNRYFHEEHGKTIEMDIYLGPLWGLNVARLVFDSVEDMQSFRAPSCAVLDVTDNGFFTGDSLVTKSFPEVQAEVARIVAGSHSHESPSMETAKESE
jgi:CYTH domain-containing protein